MYANVEAGQARRENVAEGMRTVLSQFALRASLTLGDDSLERICRDAMDGAGPGGALSLALSRWAAAENRVVLGGSAFNIKSESLRLGDFSEQEIGTLLAQHTAATGQAFTEEAQVLIRTRTAGHSRRTLSDGLVVRALVHMNHALHREVGEQGPASGSGSAFATAAPSVRSRPRRDG